MNCAESRSHGRIDSGLAAARAEAGAMLGFFAHSCGPNLDKPSMIAARDRARSRTSGAHLNVARLAG